MNRINKIQSRLATLSLLCVGLLIGCVKANDIVQGSAATGNGSLVSEASGPGSGAGGSPGAGSPSPSPNPSPTPSPSPMQTPLNGSTALKNFNQYYNGLRLATGNVPQTSVAVTIGGTTTSSTASSYFTAAASLVLPQNSSPNSMNDAVVATYPKLASYFALDFILAEEKLAAASRKALQNVDTTFKVPFTMAVAEGVGQNVIALFLNRTATPADIADIDTAYKAIYGTTPPINLTGLNNGLVVLIGPFLSCSEMAANY